MTHQPSARLHNDFPNCLLALHLSHYHRYGSALVAYQDTAIVSAGPQFQGDVFAVRSVLIRIDS